MSTTEAKYSFTTKINGDLFTVRGDSFDEFHTNLAHAGANLQAFITDVSVLQAAGHAAPLVNNSTPAAPAWAAPQATGWEQASPPPAAANAAVPVCAHGPRTPRAGNGTNGPYKAWFCPTPKGTPGQCSPIFLNKGTPEYNAFPA